MTRISAVILALSVALATPLMAQGQSGKGNKGKGHEQEHTKPAVVERHGQASVHTNVQQQGQASTHTSGRQRAAAANRDVSTRTVRRDSRGNVISTYSSSKKGSPAFCRSGAGHPVYGRSWCLEKGFGLGNSGWRRTSWDDIRFQTRRTTSIRDVLGSIIFGRVANYAAQTLGLSSPLSGSWLVNSQDRTVYLVRSGSTPVAEFVDTNYDGRADYVLLRR